MYSVCDLKVRRSHGRCEVSEKIVTARQEKKVHQFLMALCLCHSGQVAPRERGDNGDLFYGCDNESFVSDEDIGAAPLNLDELEYNAASPDEKAILEGCSYLGMKFAGEDERGNNCRVLDSRSSTASLKTYKRLHSLEFDSDRKRMSVIVQHTNGKVYLITKGAESSLLPRCVSGPVRETNSHIEEFALTGLRTLAVAMKEMTEQELASYERSLQAASLSLERRADKVRAVYDSLETDLVLLGATAIEDKLQDGVTETLNSLTRAGIAVWVLTGDKKETAVNVSLSSGHLHPDMTLLDIAGLTSPSLISSKLRSYRQQLEPVLAERSGLIVDGETLAVILQTSGSELRRQFCSVSSLCSALVCCRLSPLQKSEVVRMMKSSPGRPVTAAIGDGGNDVSMIQEADIGFGVMGREGRAAVRASDVGFSKFRNLRKVILVHGHWYYYRYRVHCCSTAGCQ